MIFRSQRNSFSHNIFYTSDRLGISGRKLYNINIRKMSTFWKNSNRSCKFVLWIDKPPGNFNLSNSNCTVLFYRSTRENIKNIFPVTLRFHPAVETLSTEKRVLFQLYALKFQRLTSKNTNVCLLICEASPASLWISHYEPVSLKICAN